MTSIPEVSGQCAQRGGHLEHDHLAMWKVAVLALAYVQTGPVTALSASGVIPFSGSGTWLSVLLSATVMALVAVVVGAFARRLVVTGSVVSYAQEAFGQRARSLSYACVESFRSPIDAATTVLPYVAAGTVASMAGTLRAIEARRGPKGSTPERVP